MKDNWNKRYATDEFVYGTEPNQFFKQELLKLPKGKLLLPAEGEGRNAVFAAQNGWDVTAFDFSREGRQKALKLAEQEGVTINYHVTGVDEFSSEMEFDCLALIYAHFPPNQRKAFHKQLIGFLKAGGTLILEGFEKAQVNKNSGGPVKFPEMLFSKEELEADFEGMHEMKLEVLTEVLSEGEGHDGEAELIRLVAKK